MACSSDRGDRSPALDRDPSEFGEFVDAVMVPFHVRSATTNLGVLASSTQQAFGTWSGTAIDGSGQQFRLDGLEGWAEQARNRW